MKKVLLILPGFLFFVSAFSQHLSQANQQILEKKEDSLKVFARQLVQAGSGDERFAADSQFTRMFVRALKINGSFEYPFDSLNTISILSPKDSSFKIFTWQLVINDDVIRQHGAIQMRTKDGSLKLYPLIDKSASIENIEDTITDNFNWIGAVYYKIQSEKAFGNTYYTLLGYDQNNSISNKKIIEILSFKDGSPVFGGSFFSFQDNSLHKGSFARYIMEYKSNASPRLTYDPELGIIVYEHMISETNEPAKKFTYIPDGDYEGLKWTDGKWVHIQKVFNQVTPQGQEPVPDPIRDAKGNIDYSKLSQRAPEEIEQSQETNSPASPSAEKPGKKGGKKRD
jgi:hypothetical protein